VNPSGRSRCLLTARRRSLRSGVAPDHGRMPLEDAEVVVVCTTPVHSRRNVVLAVVSVVVPRPRRAESRIPAAIHTF
jgi:hypothetical protein